jgi:hypothetical protein
MFPVFSESYGHQHDEVAQEEWPIHWKIKDLEEGCEISDHPAHRNLFPKSYFIHRPQQRPVVRCIH